MLSLVGFLSVLALVSANPIRPSDQAAQARQIAELNLQIAENNRLHGGAHFAQVLGHGGLFAPQPDLANLRADERVAFQKMQAELAGLVAQQRAIEASAPLANPVSAIFPNLPQPDFNNPAATAAQQAQIRQLLELVNRQRQTLANPSNPSNPSTFVPSHNQVTFLPNTDFLHNTDALDPASAHAFLTHNFENLENTPFHSSDFIKSAPSFTTTTFDAGIRDDDLRNLADAQRTLSGLVAKNERLHGIPSAIFQGENSLFRVAEPVQTVQSVQESFRFAAPRAAAVNVFPATATKPTPFESSVRADDATALADAQRRLDGLVAANEQLHGVPRAIFRQGQQNAFFPAAAPLVAPTAGEFINF